MKTITRSTLVVLALVLFAGTADAQTYKITNSLTSGTVGTPVVGALITANGIVPTLGTTYTVTAGSLPAGVTLSAQGVYTGTPTKAETANFTVQATVPAMTIPPQTAGTATAAISITIKAGAPALTIDTTTLPDGRLGDSYAASIVVSGGTSPYGFVTNPLDLPDGVTFDLTKGTLSGTPTAEGSFTFTVYVTDTTLPLPNTANRQFTVKVTAGPQLTAAGTTGWTVDREDFHLVVTASGGDGAYTFDAPTGVPAGLTPTILAESVTLTGTPTQIGETTLSVTVRDGSGATAMLSTAIRINPPVEITTTQLAFATAGAAYRWDVEAENGAPPHSFLITARSETWIGIEAGTGTLTGTPAETGSVTLTVEVTDASGSTDQREFTFEVNEPPRILEYDLPFGVVGVPYSRSLPRSRGTGPLTLSVEAGELMRGLVLTDDGIEGTPDRPGFSRLTIAVTDYWGAQATTDYELTVGELTPATGMLPASTLPADSRQALVFDLLAGTTFDVSLKAKPGASEFRATLQTIRGSRDLASSSSKRGKKSIRIRKHEVKESGRYVLLLVNRSESVAIEWSGRVRAKPAKMLKHVQSFGPLTSDVEVPFSALTGATVTLSARVKGKLAPLPELVEIVDADGSPLDAQAFLSFTKTGFKVSKMPIPASGDYRIRLRPDATGTSTGVLKLQLKVKSPKIYAYSAD